MINFVRGGTLLAQARATALNGSTSLTVPYPTQATAITPNMPGLSAGSIQAQVWQQTSSTPTFSLIGSATLTVTDSRGVSGITPSTLDLATPLDQLMQAVLATGTVTVCTQCAARRGIAEDDLREGVVIGGAAGFAEQVLRDGVQALVY